MPFEVFICYRRDSGEDFAEHLKMGLERFGVHAFLDCKDIPDKFKGTEKWTQVRDNAVVESKTFLLIVTPGFELSSEIKKELNLARKCKKKEFVYFRHRDITPNLRLVLDGEELNLGEQQQVLFDTKHDLLRKAHRILLEDKKAHVALNNEAEEVTNNDVIDAIKSFADFFNAAKTRAPFYTRDEEYFYSLGAEILRHSKTVRFAAKTPALLLYSERLSAGRTLYFNTLKEAVTNKTIQAKYLFSYN